ncbi:hypothetical protein TNCV_4585051 [Trichonephila clavipes]|nr:hypothetical protein TNCV_4585051 [Trichonephila clavipes]
MVDRIITDMRTICQPSYVVVLKTDVVAVSFPKGRNESCQSPRQVELLHNRWRHHLSPPPEFRHGTGGKYSPALFQPWFLLRSTPKPSDPLI